MKILKRFLCVCILVITLSGAKSENSNNPNEYYIIVDAGSSGSRVHLYKVSQNSFEKKQIEEIDYSSVKKTSTPLGSFRNCFLTSENPLDSFSLPLENAISYLNKNNVSQGSVSISVLSTAGMRILDESTRECINIKTKHNLQLKYPHVKFIKVETITGEKEGVYAWLDINYLKNNFSVNFENLVGIIDVGGASCQATFLMPKAESSFPFEFNLPVVINNAQNRVTVWGATGFGQEEARKTMLSAGENSGNYCFPAGFPLHKNNGVIMTEGFDFNKCIADYSHALDSKFPSGNFNISKNVSLISTSSVAYAYSFFQLSPTAPLSELKDKIIKICSIDWHSFQSQYEFDSATRTFVATQFLDNFCPNGTYMYHLLNDLYKVGKNPLYVANEIQTSDGKKMTIDWALGSLLYDLNNI